MTKPSHVSIALTEKLIECEGRFYLATYNWQTESYVGPLKTGEGRFSVSSRSKLPTAGGHSWSTKKLAVRGMIRHFGWDKVQEMVKNYGERKPTPRTAGPAAAVSVSSAVAPDAAAQG